MIWSILAVSLSLCQGIAETESWRGVGSLPDVDELKVDGRLDEWEGLPLVFFSALPEQGEAALWLAGGNSGLCVGVCLRPESAEAESLRLSLEFHPFSGLTGLGAKEFSFQLADPPSWTGPKGDEEIELDVGIMKKKGFVGFETVLPWDLLYPLVPLEGERFGLRSSLRADGETVACFTSEPLEEQSCSLAEVTVEVRLKDIERGVGWITTNGEERVPPGMVQILFRVVSPTDLGLTAVHLEAFDSQGAKVKMWEKSVKVRTGMNEIDLLLETTDLTPGSYEVKASLPEEDAIDFWGSASLHVAGKASGEEANEAKEELGDK